jgi:hypothetical protein
VLGKYAILHFRPGTIYQSAHADCNLVGTLHAVLQNERTKAHLQDGSIITNAFQPQTPTVFLPLFTVLD